MGKHEDNQFMKRFTLVIAALVVVTIFIIFIATSQDASESREAYQSRHNTASARLQPVGGVRTELSEGAASGAESVAQAPATQTNGEIAKASGGTDAPAGGADDADASDTAQEAPGDADDADSSGAAEEAADGAAIYASVCQVCHQSGAAGAPVPGTDAWAERTEKGKETLYDNAINGLNAMPAKGGRMDLTDAEVKAAVDHMLDQ